MVRFSIFLWAMTSWAVGPGYTVAGVVNGASGQAGAAPNTILSIYGTNLASGTHALTAEEMRAGAIPTTMQGTRVLLSGQLANLYFVSPGQINLLVPATFKPGKVELTVLSDAKAGPSIDLELTEAAPALFQNGKWAIATNVRGDALNEDRAASPGDVVILYATGLGPTTERYSAGELARGASFLKRFADFVVTLNGAKLEPPNILYAGVTPGFAGLYQVNIVLPPGCPGNPEIRIGFENNLSPETILLNVKSE